MSVGVPVELHEYVVPDFDVAVTAAVDATADRLVTRDRVTAVVVHLRAASARAGVAHCPEVLLHPKLDDAVGRDEPAPDRVCLVVSRNLRLPSEYRGVQPLRRQMPNLGQERPSERDRLLLEVVAEREVPQHFEKRVVTPGGADVVKVVVFPADPHALLGGGRARRGPPFATEERVLELVHPRVGEQQGRVVRRYERRASDDLVAVAGEVIEKALANLAGPHPAILPQKACRAR